MPAGTSVYSASWFAPALASVLSREGGFVDHPSDPGGATNRGVTQKVYDAYRASTGQAARSVRLISDPELGALYRERYWMIAGCPETPSAAIALLTFDAAVNHGAQRSVEFLQRAVRATPGAPSTRLSVDGIWGPATRAAARAAFLAAPLPLMGMLVDERWRFYLRLAERRPESRVFLRGWMNRIASVAGEAFMLHARATADAALAVTRAA